MKYFELIPEFLSAGTLSLIIILRFYKIRKFVAKEFKAMSKEPLPKALMFWFAMSTTFLLIIHLIKYLGSHA